LKRKRRLPVFRFDKALGVARSVKAFLSPGSVVVRGAAPDAERREERTRNQKRVRQLKSERKKRLRSEIRSKKRELSQIQKEVPAAKVGAESIERTKRKRRTQQEIFQLETELRTAKEGVAGEPVTGALPDFVVIGAKKCGTTSFYHLLAQHPYVEPAAAKELHFFDLLFDEGTEWYRRCFPQPKWKDGRRTITGEATPYYIFHPHAARRMAEVVPQARLIALLRNPVDRAYSDYQMMVRRGFESRGFEEVVEAEEARLRDAKHKLLEDEHNDSFEHQRFSYLTRGIYVDQLLCWSRFFSKEQMLVLKSEDFSKHPQDTFRLVFDFLGLPDWEPETWKVRKKSGKHDQKMDPATRRLLEEYFEPHNRRLYDFLGTDFGW
jgi:Sulfotransferase domain